MVLLSVDVSLNYLAVWIYTNTVTRFDFASDLHVVLRCIELTVVVHKNADTALN